MTDPFTNEFIAMLAGTYIASLQQAVDLITTTHPDLSPKEIVMEAERQADLELKTSMLIIAAAADYEPGDRLAEIKAVAATLPGGEVLLANKQSHRQ